METDSNRECSAVPLHCPACGKRLDPGHDGCPGCLLRLGLGVADLPMQPPPLQPGLVLGRHLLVSELGRGGMGVVYRARQLDLNRDVAVKLLGPWVPGNRGGIERFNTEAIALARITHPGIVSVHEVGIDGERAFLVMELLEGGSLAQRMDVFGKDPGSAARLLVELAEAVQAAHEAGVWHRDLKPSNILFDQQGRPRITDFGLARLAETGSALTLTGQALGTPGYVAPEQVDSSLHPIGPGADIHALGAVLYHLLTGAPPFSATHAREAFRQTLEAVPVRPRIRNKGIPADLDVICMKCLAKDPGLRYPTAAALAEDLRRHLDGRPILARGERRPTRILHWSRRHPGMASLGSALLLAILVSTVILGRIWSQARTEVRRSREVAQQLKLEQLMRLLDSGRRTAALRLLAETLRADPSDRPAATRAVSTLSRGGIALPEASFLGHTGAVVSVTETPDGSILLSASTDGTARLWNLLDPTAGPVVLPHGSPLVAAGFDPSANRFLTAGADGTVRPWGPTGQPLPGTMRHGSPITGADFHEQGGRLLTIGADGRIRVWTAGNPENPVTCVPGGEVLVARFDARGDRLFAGTQQGLGGVFDSATGSALWRRTLHDQRILDARFSPDGARITTASWDGSNGVWDAGTGESVAEPQRLESWVTTVAFGPDSRRVLAGGVAGEVSLWDPGRSRRPPETWNHQHAVNRVAFSPDGERALSAGEDGRLVLRLSRPTPRTLATLLHRNPLTDARFLRLDGSLVTVEDNGNIHLWRIPDSGNPERRLEHPELLTGEWSGDGRRMLSVGGDRTARVWDADTGRLLFSTPPLESPLVWASISPDGLHVLVNGRDGGNRLWNVGTGEGRELLPRHRRGMWRGAFSPDSRLALTLSWDGVARIWEVGAPESPSRDLVHSSPLSCAAFSPGGDFLAIGTRGGEVQVWKWPEAERVGTPLTHQNEVLSVEFSPDGRRLVSASLDRTARIWQVPDGRLLGTLVHESGVSLATFRPDGGQVATASRDRSVHLWDSAASAPTARPLLHPAQVIALDYSPGGDSLASASEDGILRIWDTGRGFPVGEPIQTGGSLGAVAYHPKQPRLLTAGSDGHLNVWPVPDLPVPVPAWFPDLLEFLASDGPDPAALKQLRVRIREDGSDRRWRLAGEGWIGKAAPAGR